MLSVVHHPHTGADPGGGFVRSKIGARKATTAAEAAIAAGVGYFSNEDAPKREE